MRVGARPGAFEFNSPVFHSYLVDVTDRSYMLIVILGTTLWFVIRVGLHWYFGVW